MAKQRVPRLEKSCPLRETHTRLHQVHTQWHRVAADYGDPDDFVTSLNAALFALRSVSFVLQKERRRIPDFDNWYAPHIERYQEPLMVWLKDSRNVVEHEHDLELHSTARVTVYGGGGTPHETDIAVSPLLHQQQIARQLASRFPERTRAGGLLAVERRWVAADLPGHELLDVLAYGYGVVAGVVADAHWQCGVVMQTFGDEAHEDRPVRRKQLDGKLSCMVAHAKLRTAYVHLGDNQLVEWGTRTQQLTREDMEDFEPPESLASLDIGRTPGQHLLEQGGAWTKAARTMVSEAGRHEPMALVFEHRDEAPILCGLHAKDTAEQHLMIQAVADQLEAVQGEGVAVIFERKTRAEDETELVVALATDDGGRAQWVTPVAHGPSGEVTLDETVEEQGVVPDFFGPIERVWVAMGRGPRETEDDATDAE